MATCERLASAYVFLRNLEHALQYVDDAQTHVLPMDAQARIRVGRLVGAASVDPLLAEYRAVQEFVAGVFDTVFCRARRGHAPRPDASVVECAG